MNTDGTQTYLGLVDRFLNLMRATFGDTFNAYYEGDPMDIPQANLPCLIIEASTGRTELDATSTDRFQSQINIRLVFNKADDFGASESQDLTERKLRQLVEGRSANGEFLDNSVLGALRKNFTLASRLIGNDIDWEYNIQPRANSIVTSEALVQIVAVERIFVPNRT